MRVKTLNRFAVRKPLDGMRYIGYNKHMGMIELHIHDVVLVDLPDWPQSWVVIEQIDLEDWPDPDIIWCSDREGKEYEIEFDDVQEISPREASVSWWTERLR